MNITPFLVKSGLISWSELVERMAALSHERRVPSRLAPCAHEQPMLTMAAS